MNGLKLSWKNITHRPLAMILSLLLFALGTGLISLLFLLQKQVQDNFEKNLAEVDLVIGAKGSPLQMILSSMYHIDAPTGNIEIDEVKAFLNPRHPLIKEALPLSLGDSYKGFRIVGTESKILNWYHAKIDQGDLWSANFEVVIGSTVAEKLQLKIGDRFKSSHGLDDAEDLEHEDASDFIVKGILSPTGSTIDQLIMTTLQTYWMVHDHEEIPQSNATDADSASAEHEHDHEEHDHEHHSHEEHDHIEPIKSILDEDGSNSITNVLIRFKGRNFQALNMQRSINENTDMQAATPAIEINRLFSMMSSGERALRILAIVIIFVSALSIFISLFSSLRERRYELALMRSMGATPNRLFGLIITEGLILAIIGYLIGITASHIAMWFVANMMSTDYHYSFEPFQFVKEEGFLFVGALIIGLIAALIPAIQARNTDIADTLLGQS